MKRLCATLCAAISLALLSGCDGAADGYRYERTEFVRDQVEVSVITYPTLEALRHEAARRNVPAKPGEGLFGFGTIHPTEPRCTIHIVDPAQTYRPQHIGHEFAHCIRGRFHGAAPQG